MYKISYFNNIKLDLGHMSLVMFAGLSFPTNVSHLTSSPMSISHSHLAMVAMSILGHIVLDDLALWHGASSRRAPAEQLHHRNEITQTCRTQSR